MGRFDSLGVRLGGPDEEESTFRFEARKTKFPTNFRPFLVKG